MNTFGSCSYKVVYCDIILCINTKTYVISNRKIFTNRSRLFFFKNGYSIQKIITTCSSKLPEVDLSIKLVKKFST